MGLANGGLKCRNRRLGTIRKGVDLQRFLVHRPAQDKVLTAEIVVVEQVPKESGVLVERGVVQLRCRKSKAPAKLAVGEEKMRTGRPLNGRAIPAAVRADPARNKHDNKIP